MVHLTAKASSCCLLQFPYYLWCFHFGYSVPVWHFQLPVRSAVTVQQFLWPSGHWHSKTLHVSCFTFIEFLYSIFWIWIYFQPSFLLYSYLTVLLYYYYLLSPFSNILQLHTLNKQFLKYKVLQLFCSYSSWHVVIFPMLIVLCFYVFVVGIIIIIIIIIIMILVKAFSPRFFSWTNGDLHRSGFKYRTAVLYVLVWCSQYRCFLVVNLLNVYY